MTNPCRIASLLIVALLTLAATSAFVSLTLYLTAGAIEADYYYLPLREFVAKEKWDAMTELVVDLSRQKQRRMPMFSIVRDFILVVGLMVLWRIVLQLEQQNAE